MKRHTPSNKILDSIIRATKSNFFYIILTVSLVIISYGQTLQMYFWQDDSALIFKLQHPEGAAGSWGVGLLDRGPYRYAVALFVPFFKIFQLEPFWYFLVGLLVYLLTVLFVYIFTKELTQKKILAYFSALIFAAGYIGSDSMFRIANSWHNNLGVIFALITLYVYTKYLRSRNKRFYLLSLLLYLATIELIFIRSHSLVIAILGLDILFYLSFFKLTKLPFLLLRQIPFWLFFKFWYLQADSSDAIGIGSLIRDIFLQKQVVKLSSLWADIGNGVIADAVQTKIILFLSRITIFPKSLDSQIIVIHSMIFLVATILIWYLGKIFKNNLWQRFLTISLVVCAIVLNLFFYLQQPLWYRDIQTVNAGLIGMLAWIISLYYSWNIWKKNQPMAVSLIFSLFFISSQIFSYYSKYPETVFQSTHRYFVYSFVGFSIFWGSVLYLLSEYIKRRFGKYSLNEHSRTKVRSFLARRNKIIVFIPFSLFILVNLYLGVIYQHKIVVDRSQPSRKFYQDLKSLVPAVQKGSIFYFSVDPSNFYQRQFDDFFSVGSMPNSTALAIYYNIDRDDIVFLTNYDELLSYLASGRAKLDGVYVFSYGSEGLIDLTLKTRSFLAQTNKPQLLTFQSTFQSKRLLQNNVTIGQTVQIPLPISKIDSITPLSVTVDAVISYLEPPQLFPYFQNSVEPQSITTKQKEVMLLYVNSRQHYYQTAKFSSLSEWKYRELRNINDYLPETVWQGSRIWWHDYKKEQLIVDLGEDRKISRILWQNWRNFLSPISYTFSTSLDGKAWNLIKQVKNGPERKDEEWVIEDFTPQLSRYLKMEITKTLTDDSPAITEFEVIDTAFTDINPVEAVNFAKNPFGNIANLSEWEIVQKNNNQNSVMEVSLFEGNDSQAVMITSYPIVIDGQMHSYKIDLPHLDYPLSKLVLSINLPVNISLEKVQVKNLSLNELIEDKLIKNFLDK